ncbi:hypothetical protein JCM17380_38660 [Desulfosporosinus burensis]
MEVIVDTVYEENGVEVCCSVGKCFSLVIVPVPCVQKPKHNNYG